MYELYAFPACEKCAKLKEQMDSRGISYEEINAGSSQGKQRLRELLKNNREQLRRDEQGWLVLPLVVSKNDGTAEIFQGEACLEKIVK